MSAVITSKTIDGYTDRYVIALKVCIVERFRTVIQDDALKRLFETYCWYVNPIHVICAAAQY